MGQLRITIPQWIKELKGWSDNSHIEFVPLVADNDNPITNETMFILKEVKRNGK